tara:strand:+ start:599 stop:1024 length:426 start_codon:yes stop_codon:yes gene_type:complete
VWLYNEQEFKTEDISDNVGFVYEIYDKQTKMFYVGKKRFWSKVSKPPLKGRKNRRRSVKESDWQDYYGSSEEVKTLVEDSGRDRFERRILRLCKTLGEMSYYEAKIQFEADVLLKPDKYYNAFIGCKIHRKHILKVDNKLK